MDLDVVPQRNPALGRYRVRLVDVRGQQLALPQIGMGLGAAFGHDGAIPVAQLDESRDRGLKSKDPGNDLGMGFWVEDDDAEVHEADTIHRLAQRLHDRFPTVPDPVVDDVVDSHFHELDGRPIREYVPLLVEHAATEDLRHLAVVR